MKEDSVAASRGGISESGGRETVSADKASVDIVQEVSPNFTNICKGISVRTVCDKGDYYF